MPTVVVTRVQRVSDSVVAVDFVAADGGAALPSWTPGSHVDVTLPIGEVRQYSLCGDPTSATWRIAVLREESGRGGSRYICDQLKVGDRLEVGQARNNFPLEPAAGYCFIAGGIGITPLLPMMAEVASRELPMVVHYGGRRRSSMAFLEAVESYGDRARVLPEDAVGLLPLGEILDGLPRGWSVYCCGPEPLLRAVEDACASRPEVALRVERFAATEHTAAEDALAEYTVLLQRSEVEVRVSPDTTLLDAIEAAGVEVDQECREGICGACETKVLDGDPDHRDSILTATEKALCSTMFVCVSGSKTPRLVLDL